MNSHPLTRRSSGLRGARGRRATVMALAALVVVTTGCDQDLLDDGVVLDNRSGNDLTVYALVEMADGSVQRSTLAQPRPARGEPCPEATSAPRA